MTASKDRKQREKNMSELEKRVKEWVNSPTGSAKLLETQKKVKEAVEHAEKAALIKPELLRKPITL